jgi:hypothetical protein
MIRKKKVKGYWIKKQEVFANGAEAKSRAGYLRTYAHDQVAHVTMKKVDENYIVTYSVAKWFLEQLRSVGGRL